MSTITAARASAILSAMAGQTITQGWDVICAMDAARINSLLAQQWVANVALGETLPPINDTVPVISNISVQFIDLVLGPPLIAFSPKLAPQEAYLTINFIAGTVLTLQGSGNTASVLAVQTISPTDGYQLTGVVPLQSVQGQVQNQHDVVIKITDGTAFSANLGISGGAATTLGAYFLQVIQQNASLFNYSLGTLVYDAGSTNLVPVLFDFATQIDGTDSTDTGRLLLFIATTYNPNGGAQTSLPLANIVPDGQSTALIISSEVLFKEILAPAISGQVKAEGVSVAAVQNGPSQAYALSFSGGIDVGVVQTSQDINTYVSGTAENNGTSVDEEHVVVPLSSLSLTAASTDYQLGLNLRSTWDQDWACGQPMPRIGISWSSGDVTMHANASSVSAGSVDPNTQVVSFGGDMNLSVSFDSSSWWQKVFVDGGAADIVGNLVQQTATAQLQELLSFTLPSVNTFAVSNLLFPQQHILDFQNVYVPGDLIIFGDVMTSGIAVTPLLTTLTGGDTVQLTATGDQVNWSVTPPIGTVSATGLYTAPPRVKKTLQVTVTATSKTNSQKYASASITLVPAGIEVTPTVTLMTPSSLPQTFSAAQAGAPAPVTWKLNPSVGTITSAGLYTAPTTVGQTQAVTVTAAIAKLNGSGQVILAASTPAGVGVAPSIPQQPLSAGETQAFTATLGGTSGQSFTWSLYPAIGSIDANGLYTAPSVIEAPAIVMVVATSTITSELYGTALVTLAP